MEYLIRAADDMAANGIRRLLVISGDNAWCEEQSLMLARQLPGDWLWVGDAPLLPVNCAPAAVRTLLGQEFLHAVFDARSGFDAEALAVLAGTLKAGSWLLLLAPDWIRWPQQPDCDAIRWSDSARPIATPHFIRHLQQTIASDPESLCWRQDSPLKQTSFSPRPRWQPACGAPHREQENILAELLAMNSGVAVITAPRGRGKSALAGMLLARFEGAGLVTAPSRAATDVIAAHAGDAFEFVAPDALLAALPALQADWLIIDEAAALPGPVLRKLIRSFPRVLLTTTIQGYEGTGRGFLLKFCASVPHLRQFALSMPVRWAAGDPLEQFIDSALLFEDDDFSNAPQGEVSIQTLDQSVWRQQPERAAALYRLLSGAHYRTSPLDLRRMMDAPGQRFIAAETAEKTVGALWLVKEGGLSEALSQAVWAGFRRPRGNLVAQSLAAHGGDPLAATLKGWRISRIAVHPSRQREGTGQALVTFARRHLPACDYLSVSFGYTPELWRFWQACGFTLARFGSHREASSGCYTAMALLALTPQGEALVRLAHQRLQRDGDWLQPWVEEILPVSGKASTLNDNDWRELAGFAWGHRPLETSIGCLHRLLLASALPLSALRGRLEKRLAINILCQHLRLSGRKALLAVQRQEAALALASLDATRAQALKEWVLQLQFFH
ncbi:MAG TPA: tRNA(Met) cytidine acetyltransferase [Franconibacter helveticus]|uniref:tRNA(Met) cytidine acetyltransferase TmcA n=3 Tax=Franconibacter helveticus TaxID=357240 RepID=UPI000407E0BD|nr:GNAT family N-acetyltransferase [Franconibacter helveticus]HAZ54716.1 tRNA(Met) cytidine acetyltransferase [Franconibacter helveticus]